jgi:hypothetical protein
MPGPLVHVGAVGMCPHLGQISVVSSNVRVFVSGMPVATMMDTYPILGCIFTLPGTPPIPHPCVRVQWLVPATRVFVNAQPAILQLSTGLCLAVDMVPQGPPTIVTTQPRVIGM